MKTILSFGGGVDSSTILLMHLMGDDQGIDHVVFSDTGAESSGTYDNVEFFAELCEDAGLPFTVVWNEKETITEWVTRNGTLPLMPGAGAHACSNRFKRDVIQKWVGNNFPGEKICYLIGLEANEGKRSERFSAPKGDEAAYRYPLQDLDMTRQDCLDYLDGFGIEVPKSSCVFCPYMKKHEIIAMRQDPAAWQTIKLVEARFQETSPAKHQAWLDAGKPVRSDGKCGAGHWRLDSWAEGKRLFQPTIDGKRLSVPEWETHIDSMEVTA